MDYEMKNIQAKTFKSRDETKTHAVELCSALNVKSRAYRINSVDCTVCSKATLTTVSRELYALGYKAVNFLNVEWQIDPDLKDAKIYAKAGKDPILIRETSTQWGVVITLLGPRMPVFYDALDALDSIITNKRMVTIMHPVEGTSGLALECKLRQEVTARRVISADGMGSHNSKIVDPIKADDVLLSQGFVRHSSAYISMKLGVLVSLTDSHLVLVDTPWSK
jgi:hypothetical protein